MEFEWDENKAQQNLAKHGLDFARVRTILDGRDIMSNEPSRGLEERFASTAQLDDIMVTIIWTKRGDSTRIISARRARDGEKRAYRALYER